MADAPSIPKVDQRSWETGFRETDPANYDAEELAEYLTDEVEGGWGPKEFVIDDGDDRPVCERFTGRDPGPAYGLTTNRGIWQRWYAVGWGCQSCAEVLHS